MKIATQNSVAFKHQMAVGRAISKRLDKQFGALLTQQQVGDMLGLSCEGVRRIEYRALYKLMTRLKGKI